MQVAALRKAQELSMAFFQRMPVSDIYARITQDTNAIYTAMTNGFIDTIREPFTVLSIIISMLVIDLEAYPDRQLYAPSRSCTGCVQRGNACAC